MVACVQLAMPVCACELTVCVANCTCASVSLSPRLGSMGSIKASASTCMHVCWCV